MAPGAAVSPIPALIPQTVSLPARLVLQPHHDGVRPAHDLRREGELPNVVSLLRLPHGLALGDAGLDVKRGAEPGIARHGHPHDRGATIDTRIHQRVRDLGDLGPLVHDGPGELQERLVARASRREEENRGEGSPAESCSTHHLNLLDTHRAAPGPPMPAFRTCSREIAHVARRVHMISSARERSRPTAARTGPAIPGGRIRHISSFFVDLGHEP